MSSYLGLKNSLLLLPQMNKVHCFIPDSPLNEIIFPSHHKMSQVQEVLLYSPCSLLLIPDVFSTCPLEKNVLLLDVKII